MAETSDWSSMNKQRDRVLPRLIEDEMRESFLDYSMSVIVQRALPDVRDGLKPVHRRILYAMHEAGLTPARPFKKSATVVGDVLGKYHPHGDASVYDALVRMVQEFSLRYPLVDGQGNFGSIDGDSAAAYRYTEARLSSVATEMLADIDRETVDFAPNYDDRLSEPTVLPSRLPNLLVNGSSGIAVGMSTNVPPHNVGEVAAAAAHLLDHPDCTIDDLMAHLPGPDFPTGGVVVGRKGIRDAYEKGRGRVVMRARVFKEQKRTGREQLVVTEIPYGSNKSRIIEQIADLSKEGKLADVSDLRDESDRDGIRIVVELKKGADAVKTLERLFKATALQSTFGVIALALDGGVPREFNLKQILERWRDHRIQVVVRRSRWEVERARDEAHVLEGLVAALRQIDLVVQLIRSSKTRETAARKLEKELRLTERQSEAILSMRLSRLTALETRELKEKHAALLARIAELDAILGSRELQVAAIRAELAELAERYGDTRRTDIVDSEKDFSLKDLLADEQVVVMVSREGYLKQIPMSVYRRRRLLGKALADEKYENDYLEHLFFPSTAETLAFFTEDGRVHWLSVRDVPDGGRGKRVQQIFELHRRARVAAILSAREFPETRYVVFLTADGTVKRTSLDQYGRPRAGGIEAISLKAGDRVVDARVTDGEAEVVVASSGGRAIRFREDEVPLMGRVAQGVRGIKLKAGETAAGLALVRRDAELCVVTDRGHARRVPLEELPVQGRGGMGTAVVGPKDGRVAGAREVHPGEDLMAVTAVGRTLRLTVAALGTDALSPEPALPLSAHDRIVEVTPLAEPARARGDDDDGGDDDGGGGESLDVFADEPSDAGDDALEPVTDAADASPFDAAGDDDGGDAERAASPVSTAPASPSDDAGETVPEMSSPATGPSPDPGPPDAEPAPEPPPAPAAEAPKRTRAPREPKEPKQPPKPVEADDGELDLFGG
jgi:DNA gyrase subunit A